MDTLSHICRFIESIIPDFLYHSDRNITATTTEIRTSIEKTYGITAKTLNSMFRKKTGYTCTEYIKKRFLVAALHKSLDESDGDAMAFANYYKREKFTDACIKYLGKRPEIITKEDLADFPPYTSIDSPSVAFKHANSTIKAKKHFSIFNYDLIIAAYISLAICCAFSWLIVPPARSPLFSLIISICILFGCFVATKSLSDCSLTLVGFGLLCHVFLNPTPGNCLPSSFLPFLFVFIYNISKKVGDRVKAR